MRKIFLNAAALSLALVMVTPALQSCKDYDDDITNINGVNDNLAKQILDLQTQVKNLSEAQKNAAQAAADAATAAEAARKLAEEALQAGNKAEAEALAAQAMAADAKAAAEKAKADALDALTKEADALKALINTNTTNIADAVNNIAKNAQAIAALDGKVAAIDAKLANYSTTEQMVEAINKAIADNNGSIDSKIDAAKSELLGKITALNTRVQAVETQQTTLQNYITDLQTNYSNLSGRLDGLSSKIDTQEQTIAGLQTRLGKVETDLAELKTKVDTNAGDIADIQTTLGEIDTKLTEIDGELDAIAGKLTTIESALNTLNGINAKRLTSLTLIPTSYIGGIPSIEFYSASFKAWGKIDATTGIYAAAPANAQPIIVTNNDTKVLYRMNPAGVSLNDIVAGDVAFVQQTATSRAAETPVVKVVNVEKNDEGQLVVTATKADGVTSSINQAEGGKIYTVALKVPIAPENYYSWKDENGNKVTESKEDAVVYSEYSRIAESTFVPEIAWNKEYAEGAAIEHFWNTSIWTDADVDAVVDVNYAAEDFDLTTLVTGCMNDNGKCALMTAAQLESFGFTFEYSVPGKEYLVENVNQQVYANVTADGKLTPVQPTGLTAASRVDKTPIISVVMKHGNDVIDQRFFKVKYVISAEATTFDIDVFTQELACESVSHFVDWKTFTEKVINELPFPISKDEFAKMYSWSNAPMDRITVDMEAENNLITFEVAPADYQNMNGKNKELKKTLTFKSDVTGFPEITVNLNGTINWPAADKLPVLGGTSSAYWNNGYMEVMPEAMPVPYTEGVTATYHTNILAGRFAPYITNLLTCANWDIQIKSVTNGFTVGAAAPADDAAAYKVMDGTDQAASIWSGDDQHEPFGLNGDDAKEEFKMFFDIQNNAAGIKLVDQKEASIVNLGWYTYLNGMENNNSYALFNTNLRIIAPLKSVNLKEGRSVTQNTTVQYLELSDGLTITDCFNNEFSSGSDYWKYYDIEPMVDGVKQAIVWNNDIKVSEVVNPKPEQLMPLSTFEMEAVVDQNGKLSFTGSGIKLQKPLYLNVNVTVPHKWGKLETTVLVTIQPNANN